MQREITVDSRTQAINGKIYRGDYVIAIGNNDYAYLIGKITEILKHGTPEYAEETDNDTDSVHVNFMILPYSSRREVTIVEHFNSLCNSNETMFFGELPIDDVIMAPNMLIRITELGEDKINNLLSDCDEAKLFCDNVINSLFSIE